LAIEVEEQRVEEEAEHQREEADDDVGDGRREVGAQLLAGDGQDVIHGPPPPARRPRRPTPRGRRFPAWSASGTRLRGSYASAAAPAAPSRAPRWPRRARGARRGPFRSPPRARP